jgi:kinesin family protein 1
MYAHSNELDEVGVISLSGSGVKVEWNPDMEALYEARISSSCSS